MWAKDGRNLYIRYLFAIFYLVIVAYYYLFINSVKRRLNYTSTVNTMIRLGNL